MKESKKKILFVGAFPKSQNVEIYGGQLTVCNLLAKSELKNKYDLIFIDSTSIKIPVGRKIREALIIEKRRLAQKAAREAREKNRYASN